MIDKSPLISICIPAYNCANYIKETLICICSQNYENIEIILVNDGSTDNTGDIASRIYDKRIKIINVTNGGASRARNIALQHAKGTYIVFFDADDYIYPNFITTQIEFIKEDEESIVMSGWGRFYNNDITTFKLENNPQNPFTFYDWIVKYWRAGNAMTNPGRALIPKRVIEQAGLWNQQLTLNDDFDFFARIFRSSSKIYFNNNSALLYRSGINGLSNTKDIKGFESLFSSTSAGINQALSEYPNEEEIKHSCANILQLFVYTAYPTYPKLVKEGESLIKDLGGSDLTFPSGKITQFISKIIGWKNAKRIRSKF